MINDLKTTANYEMYTPLSCDFCDITPIQFAPKFSHCSEVQKPENIVIIICPNKYILKKLHRENDLFTTTSKPLFMALSAPFPPRR